MELSAYYESNGGGRTVNEDALGVFYQEGMGVFLLADGLGGHEGGEIASRTAVDTMLSNLKGYLETGGVPCEEAMRKAFMQGNVILMERQQTEGPEFMMTTAVALMIRDRAAVWGHVGDSRLYYISGGKVTEISRDHSVSYKKYLSGEISFRDVNTDEDRCGLLQALGGPRCAPDIDGVKELADGDAFLLCSDGFWENLYNEEILEDLQKAATPQEWARLLLERHKARMELGSDNFSLITVFATNSANR